MNRLKTIVVLIAAAVVMSSAASPVRSNLGGDGEEYGDVETYTASDYVQEGLVAMWDGIENAGLGEHVASGPALPAPVLPQ